MNNNKICVNWHGPYKFKKLFSNNSNTTLSLLNNQGIYLWKEWDEKNQNAKIVYIGKASGNPTVLKRLRQHYIYQISLFYSTPQQLLGNQNYWDGRIEDEKNFQKITDLDSIKDILDKGYEYTKKIELYAGLFDEPITSKELKIVERVYLYNLKPMRTIQGTKSIVEHMPIENKNEDIILKINDKIIEENNKIWTGIKNYKK